MELEIEIIGRPTLLPNIIFIAWQLQFINEFQDMISPSILFWNAYGRVWVPHFHLSLTDIFRSSSPPPGAGDTNSQVGRFSWRRVTGTCLASQVPEGPSKSRGRSWALKQWCQDPVLLAILPRKLNRKNHCNKGGDHTDPRKTSWASGGLTVETMLGRRLFGINQKETKSGTK